MKKVHTAIFMRILFRKTEIDFLNYSIYLLIDYFFFKFSGCKQNCSDFTYKTKIRTGIKCTRTDISQPGKIGSEQNYISL